MPDQITLPALGIAVNATPPDNTYVWWYDTSITSNRLEDKIKIYNRDSLSWQSLSSIAGSGGSSDRVPSLAFTDLIDTFNSYTGKAGQGIVVNAYETGLESIALTGTGTVTNVSSANGSATVANPTTTPTITIVSSPKTSALVSASTAVDVSAATAPTAGQALIATSGTAATWQTIVAGGETLAQTLALGNTTGGNNIVVTNSDTITSQNGNIQLDFINGTGLEIGVLGSNGYLGVDQTEIYARASTAAKFKVPDFVIGEANSKDGKITFVNAGTPYKISFLTSQVAANITYLLPEVDPTAGQILTASLPVANVSTLSWTTVAAGDETLAQTLALGNTTSGSNIVMSSGDNITSADGTNIIALSNSGLIVTATDGTNIAQVTVSDSGYIELSNTDGITVGELAVLPVGVRINNDYVLPTVDGSNGQIIQTDGFGALSFVTPASGISGLTTNELVYGNTATTIASLPVATYPSLTELSYIKGATSSIQTQLNTLNTKTNMFEYYNIY